MMMGTEPSSIIQVERGSLAGVERALLPACSQRQPAPHESI